MSRRPDTRQRILRIAERLVMELGYHAFSYKHVADELGVKAAAIHYHFATKPQLVVAVLERYEVRFGTWSSALDGANPIEQFDAYTALARSFIQVNRICALGMMAADFNSIPTAVQDQTIAVQTALLAWITDVLSRGREQGLFDFDGAASDQAAALAATMLGAQQMGRVSGEAAFERVVCQLRQGLIRGVAA